MKHANISIFVPHIGCPNNCAFCNQYLITKTEKAPTNGDIIEAVNIAVQSKNYSPRNTEIAFFGGSFTAIDRKYMLSLLETAYTFVQKKAVKGIRISTRPDAINEEILRILKTFGVTAIELGAQSMNDEVLLANKRGHLSSDVVNAAKLIKDFGFELGLQMMTGMYKSDEEKDIFTAKEIIKLSPTTVRIYPTITLKGTYLETLYKAKEYMPMSLDTTVCLCAKLLTMFENENIKVIRLGLHTVEQNDYVAGPFHPSFRELCEGEIFLEKIKSMLTRKGDYLVLVNEKDLSKAIGQQRKNIEKLKELGLNCTVKSDNSLEKSEVKILRV